MITTTKTPRAGFRLVRRASARVAGVLILVFVVVGVTLAWFTVNPRADPPQQVDALLVLSSQYDSGQAAFDLGQDEIADLLIVSVPPGVDKDLCRDAPGNAKVVCFEPDPVTTQGEAMIGSEIARQHGVQSLGVITYDYHLERARLVVGRCWEGELKAFDFRPSRGLLAQTYDFTYAMVAYGKAFLISDCEAPLPEWLQTPIDKIKHAT